MNQSVCRCLLFFLVWGLLLPSPLLAGTINRGTKAAGGTDFSDATTASAAEVNTDFNNLYNEFNGSVESVNIALDTILAVDIAAGGVATSELLDGTIVNIDVGASAAIDPSKLDDHSTNSTEHLANTMPTTSDVATGLPTTLQDEILDLRGVIERIAIGSGCSEINAGGATATSCNWVDGPIQGGNLVYNGGFDLWGSAAGAAGNGWALVATPSTLASENLVESQGKGDGIGINMIANAANEGISQNLVGNGLWADTRYLALVDVRPDVLTCSIDTVGADTNELAVTSASGGSAWATIGGVFETDSTPADVLLRLLAVSNTSDCVFDNVRVFRLGPDPSRRQQVMIDQDCNTAAATFDAGGSPVDFSAEGGTDITVAVTPYANNTIVEVWAHGTAEATGAAGDWALAIDENGSDVVTGSGTAAAANQNITISLSWVNLNPTPGDILTYELQGADLSGTIGFPDSTLASSACLTVKMTSP